MTRETIACGRCRTIRSEEQWSSLRRVARVDGEGLSGVVVRWPVDVVVIVRECSCGALIARLASRDSEHGDHGTGSSNDTQ
ncbi:MAG TPA: hypothetical protein VGM06_12015 [Polyangiaceae bacterium]|jgi:hypothetical protein